MIERFEDGLEYQSSVCMSPGYLRLCCYSSVSSLLSLWQILNLYPMNECMAFLILLFFLKCKKYRIEQPGAASLSNYSSSMLIINTVEIGLWVLSDLWWLKRKL